VRGEGVRRQAAGRASRGGCAAGRRLCAGVAVRVAPGLAVGGGCRRPGGGGGDGRPRTAALPRRRRVLIGTKIA